MKAIGIILAGGNNNRMKELTAKRAVPALPIAGSFRAIDFSLSSMSNSHIQTVAILTQYNACSLNEHLSSAKWWNFGRKQGGLFIFTPTVTADNSDWYRGTADAMYQNIDFLKRRHEPYVIISSGDCVYKLDFNRVLDFHIEKKSDITVVCKDMMYNDDVSRFGVVRMDDESRITEFDEKPIEASSNTISTGIYVIDKNAIATVIDSKNKPKTEEKPKKPNLGINKKHHDESVDDTSASESTNDITLGNTEDVSIDSKEDVKIDNDEDIKF